MGAYVISGKQHSVTYRHEQALVAVTGAAAAAEADEGDHQADDEDDDTGSAECVLLAVVEELEVVRSMFVDQ